MTTYYIVLTIGPVQHYISQARRTQDLWQGSTILSYLALVGVDHVEAEATKNGSIDLIYPRLPALNDEKRHRKGVPNRMIIEVTADDEAVAVELAQSTEAQIRAAHQTVAGNTYDFLVKQVNGVTAQFDDIWQRQVENWLECYWVVVPAKGDGYASHINQANAAMGQRKLLRDFGQVAEPGRKCSVTGEHEALLGNREYADFWENMREKQRNLSLLSQGERLSAIATIKRFAHEKNPDTGKFINPDLAVDERFPSTSSIAAATFRYDVLRHWDTLESNVVTYLDALEALFPSEKVLYFAEVESFPYFVGRIPDSVLTSATAERFLSIDGDYLFEDTLISTTIAEYAGINDANGKPDPKKVNEKALKRAQEALQKLIAAAKKAGINPPNPYLVILSMDGDNMGKTLGAIKTKGDHKLFSETIAGFAASTVPEIVEKQYLGRAIYAGGDDVLALLPVRDALQVAEALRNAFHATVRDAKIPCESNSKYGYSDGSKWFVNATASAGLAYVHHTHNLQQAIDTANDTQKNVAKKRLDRNAIAVRFLRRSGEPREMGQKWELEPGDKVIGRVADLVEAFAEDTLSRNLPQDILAIIYSMTDPENEVDDLAAPRRAELERVLRRRVGDNFDGDKKQFAADLADHLIALTQLPKADDDPPLPRHLFREEDVNRVKPQSTQARWTTALHWVELARFIAQSGLSESQKEVFA